MAASGQSQWVYLDHAATTPVDRRVAQIMTTFLNGDDYFGNPSSVDHPFGWAAREWVEKARGQVAALIGAKPAEIIWTSGATESNNLAILGGARYHGNRGKHIVTSRIEHPATFDTCRQLEKEGFRVTYLKPDRVGMIHPRQVAEALSSDTILVSIMHVNNEIGVVNDIAAIGELCRGRGIAFHVDAAQSAGKLPIDVVRQYIDLLSLSAHKMSGPKGIGALYVRREPPLGLQPLIFGGGQEAGMRSGTLPTHQIVGMGAACEIARNEGPDQVRQLQALRDRLWERLSKMPATQLNGDLQRLAPHILNVCFSDVEGESLIAALHKHHVAVSSGSACSSASREPSYVLRALGRSDAQAQASLRFSFGRGIGEEDVDRVAEAVHQAVTLLRELSPASEGKDATSKRAGSAPTIDPSSPGWISGEAGGIEQGTWVRFHVRTDGGQADGGQAGRQVIEARYKVYGCPQTMAAAEWVVQRLPGRRLDALLPEGVRILAQAVDLPPEKLGRLLPIEDALRRIGRPWPSP